MNKTKKLFSLICVVSLIFCGSNAMALSNEAHDLVPSPPVDSTAMPFGTGSPTLSNPTYNLSSQTYSYNCEDIANTLYTDAWFKGSSTMVVKINNFKCLTDSGFHGGAVTVKVYNTHDKVVGSQTADMAAISNNTVSFTGLAPESKYYVSFTVSGAYGYHFSFNGTVANWI